MSFTDARSSTVSLYSSTVSLYLVERVYETLQAGKMPDQLENPHDPHHPHQPHDLASLAHDLEVLAETVESLESLEEKRYVEYCHTQEVS